MEKTLTIIKHEAVKKGIVGEIINKIEKTGLKIFQMKVVKPTKKQASSHYVMKDDVWLLGLGEKTVKVFMNNDECLGAFGTLDYKKIGQRIYQWSVDQLIDKEVIIIVWIGENAIAKVKEIVGSYEPAYADLSTIRGMYSSDSYRVSGLEKRAIYNVVHRSTSPQEAEREINVWF